MSRRPVKQTTRSVGKVRAAAAHDHLRIARDHLEAAQQDLCSLRGAAPLSWQLREAKGLVRLVQRAIDCDAGDRVEEPAECLFELDREPLAKDVEPHVGCSNRLKMEDSHLREMLKEAVDLITKIGRVGLAQGGEQSPNRAECIDLAQRLRAAASVKP